jgi:transcriptional regulator with XRE-family HTH domain
MGQVRFGLHLRELREGKGMSRDDLATKVGCSYRAIEQWERGEREPQATMLMMLSDALQVGCEVFSAALKTPDPEAPADPRPRGRPKKADSPPAAETTQKKGKRR